MALPNEMLYAIFQKLQQPYLFKVATVCKRFLAIIKNHFTLRGLKKNLYLVNEKYLLFQQEFVICGCEFFITAPNIVKLFYECAEISYLDDLEFKLKFCQKYGDIRIVATRVKPHPLMFCCSKRLKIEIVNNNSNAAIDYLLYLRKEFKFEFFASEYFNCHYYKRRPMLVCTNDYNFNISDRASLNMM
mgnify:CR=1 FL=1